MRRWWRREPQPVVRELEPPFAALMEPSTADYRGIPTLHCACGYDYFLVCVKFDAESWEPVDYLLDARCSSCGAKLTAPNGADKRMLDEAFGVRGE